MKIDKNSNKNDWDPNKDVSDQKSINEKLPSDMFKNVLSYLDGVDMQQATSVDKFWNETSIDTAKHQEFLIIEAFVNFLCDNLKEEPYKDQRTQLLDLVNGDSKDNTILTSATLLQIKSSLCELKEDILNTLKTLEMDKLKTLENLCHDIVKPKFFESLFDLARIYREIGEYPSSDEKDYRLCGLCLSFLSTPDIDQAILAAEMISNKDARENILFSIARALMQDGRMEEVVLAADMISNKDARENILFSIARALMQDGRMEEAVLAAEMISNKDARGNILFSIAVALMQSGRIEEAVKVGKKIPSEQKRREFFE